MKNAPFEPTLSAKAGSARVQDRGDGRQGTWGAVFAEEGVPEGGGFVLRSLGISAGNSVRRRKAPDGAADAQVKGHTSGGPRRLFAAWGR